MLRITGIALLIATIMAILSCGGSSPSLPPNSPPPPPNISISPTSAVAGSPDLTLTVKGSNFLGETHNFSQAVWSANSSNTLLATTFVSSTQLTAVVPAALLRNPGTAQVFVQTGDPMGDLPLGKSNSASFSVIAPSPGVPSISSISPTSAVVGSPDLTLTVTGSNFVDANRYHNVVAWSVNGSDTSLATTFVSSTQLTGVIPAALLLNPTTAKLSVQTWYFDNDTPTSVSNSVSFSVNSPAAGISSGFVPVGNMSRTRYGHTASLLMNGKVLIAGGSDETAELFDPASESFAPTGSMSTSRYGATATLLANGKVLIVGGFGSGTSELPRLATAELYDPLRGIFSETGSTAFPRVLHAATLLSDGRVLITGGTIDNVGGGVATATSEVYDPSTGAFTIVGNMITDRAQHSATLLADGQVFVVGGWNGHAADAADDPPWDPLLAELYNPKPGTFTSSGSMGTTRIGLTAIRLTNGKVLILGGIPNPQNVHAQPIDTPYAQLYDAVAHTFTAPWNLTTSRTGYSSTLLISGKVLLAGGENLGRAVGTAELFDLASGSLTATGGLVTEREGHTPSLLLDGRVLVTGGVDSNGNTLTSAEVYK